MNKIELNSNNCSGCGVCTDICPRQLFFQDDNRQLYLADDAGERCVNCGHCISVCATNGIKLNGSSSNDLQAVAEQRLSESQVEDLVKSRRSIRTYKNEEVDRRDLEKLVNISRWAPTAKNHQDIEWTAISSVEKIRNLSEMCIEMFKKLDKFEEVTEAWDQGRDMFLRGAPALLIAHAPKDDKRLFLFADASIALMSIELVAPSVGLGTCWGGFFTAACRMSNDLRRELQIPEDREVFGSLMVGYPKHKYLRVPERKEARIMWPE